MSKEKLNVSADFSTELNKKRIQVQCWCMAVYVALWLTMGFINIVFVSNTDWTAVK